MVLQSWRTPLGVLFLGLSFFLGCSEAYTQNRIHTDHPFRLNWMSNRGRALSTREVCQLLDEEAVHDATLSSILAREGHPDRATAINSCTIFACPEVSLLFEKSGRTYDVRWSRSDNRWEIVQAGSASYPPLAQSSSSSPPVTTSSLMQRWLDVQARCNGNVMSGCLDRQQIIQTCEAACRTAVQNSVQGAINSWQKPQPADPFRLIEQVSDSIGQLTAQSEWEDCRKAGVPMSRLCQ